MLYKYAIVIKIGWENSILKNLYCNRRPDWNTRNGEDLKLQSTTGVLGHPCNLWFDLIWFIMLELKLNYLKPNQSRKPKGPSSIPSESKMELLLYLYFFQKSNFFLSLF